MNSPQVSIIVPIYNVEKYLSKCLDSLINQTFREIEIILIDDGSKDSSGYICDKYAHRDKRIKVIHKNNEGVSIARNVGLNCAQGKWISFVDSDDWVNLDMYEILINKAQDCDLIYFPLIEQFKDGTTRVNSMPAFFSENRTLVEKNILLLKNNCVFCEFFGWTCNKLFKNEIIKRYNLLFDSCLSYREDEVFTLNYCKYIHSLQFLPIPLYNYRRHFSGLTTRKKKSEDFYLLGMYIKKSELYFSNKDLVNFELQRVYLCLLNSINLSNSWKKAFFYLKESFFFKHNYKIRPISRRDALIFKYNYFCSIILFVLASILLNRKKVFSYADVF